MTAPTRDTYITVRSRPAAMKTVVFWEVRPEGRTMSSGNFPTRAYAVQHATLPRVLGPARSGSRSWTAP